MRKDGKLVIKLNKYFFLNLSIFIITLSGSLFIVNRVSGFSWLVSFLLSV